MLKHGINDNIDFDSISSMYSLFAWKESPIFTLRFKVIWYFVLFDIELMMEDNFQFFTYFLLEGIFFTV